MADTLGTLSVGIDGNIKPLEQSLAAAEQQLKTFGASIDATVKGINVKLSQINIGNGNRGFSKVIQDFNLLVGSLSKVEQNVSNISGKLAPTMTTLAAELGKLGPLLKPMGQGMRSFATGIDKLADSAVKLPAIIGVINQFTQQLQQLSGNQGAGGVQKTGNAFNSLANTLNGQVRQALRAGSNSLSLLKGNMHGVGEEGNSLIRALTGLDIPLNKMVGRIVLVNNIWKAWGATLAAWRAGIQTVIDTSQGLANIQAITLSYGKDFAAIQKKISLTLQESIFPAKELTDAYVVLGQAGFTSTEATDAFDAVLRLATSSMSSLNDSATILTTILRTYDLQANDSVKVTNELIAATNLSKLSIEGLNTALNFAGPAAAEAGLSLNQTLAALAVMADRGMKASTQGTGLRQVLAALVDPTDKFKNKLAQLGIRMDEVNPTLHDFNEILTTLHDSGFTAADAFETLELRTAGAMNVLVSGAGVFDRMSETINESASALTSQLLQQRGLNAEIEIFKNRLYEIFLGPNSIGKHIESLIIWLNRLLEIFRSLIDTLRGNEKALASIYAVISLVAGAATLRGIAFLIDKFTGLKNVVVETTTAIKGMNAAQSAAAVFAARAAGGTGAGAGVNPLSIMERLKLGVGGVGALITGLTTGLTEALGVILAIYGIIQLVQYAVSLWKGNVDQTTQAYIDLLDAQTELNNALEKEKKLREGLTEEQIALAEAGPSANSPNAIVAAIEFEATAQGKYAKVLNEVGEAQKKVNAAQEAYNKLTIATQRSELKSALPDILAEREALKDNNIKLEDRLKTLKELAAIENPSLEKRSELLTVQTEVEKLLGIEASTTQTVIEKGTQAFADNNKQIEVSNTKLSKYKEVIISYLVDLQNQRMQYENMHNGLVTHAGDIASITVETKKWEDVLASINMYLNELPSATREFARASKEAAEDYKRAADAALDSANPVGALSEQQKKVLDDAKQAAKDVEDLTQQRTALLDGLDPTDIASYLEARNRSVEAGVNKMEELKQKYQAAFMPGENPEKDGEMMLRSFFGDPENVNKFIELSNKLANAAGRASAAVAENAKLTQKVATAKNLEFEGKEAEVKKAVEEIEKDLTTKKQQLGDLQAQAAVELKRIKTVQMTEQERLLLEQQLNAREAQVSSETIDVYNATIAKLEAKAKEMMDEAANQSPNPNNNERRRLEEIAKGITQRAEALAAERDKLTNTNELAAIDAQYDSTNAKAKQIFETNKLITQSLDDQATISKKRVKSLEVQVELEEALKDLAVSASQEQQIDYNIVELKRQIAREQLAVAENGLKASEEQYTVAKKLLDAHNSEAAKSAELQDKTKLLSQDAYNKAVETTAEYSRQTQLYGEQIDIAKNRLALLDVEYEKVDKINGAWRDMARGINDAFAKNLVDTIFGDSKNFVKNMKTTFIDGFKAVFTETIKQKVPLLDKPFKGNILELGKFVQDNLGISFQRGLTARPTAGGVDARGQTATGSARGIGGILTSVGSTVKNWASGIGSWFGSASNPQGAVADRYAAQAASAGVSIDGSGSGASAAAGTQAADVPGSSSWGSTLSTIGAIGAAGAGVANSLLKVGKQKEDATKQEKGLATAAQALSSIAVSLLSTGNIYAMIVGIILEVIALILPFFAGSAFNIFFKQSKKGLRNALLASGGEKLDVGLKDRFAGTYNALSKYGLQDLAFGGSFEDLPLNNATPGRTGTASAVQPVMGDGTNSYFLNRVLTEGLYTANSNNTVDRVQKISDAISGYNLVLAAGVKHQKAFGFAQAATNVELARMVAVGYDLSKIDLGAFYQQLGKQIGSFAKGIDEINQSLERYDKKKKDFDVEFLENSIRGLAAIFSKDFPAGVDVASHAISLFRQNGKIDMDKLKDDLSNVVKAVGDAAKKIADTPIKVVLQGGTSTLGLDQLEKQINDFTKEFLTTNILDTVTSSVIKEGFLTPIIDQVQFLSAKLYEGSITNEEYGRSLNQLFQKNLIPNITNFKSIMTDTFRILSSTLGFPLDLLPAFFTIDANAKTGQGLTFDNKTMKRNKTFTTSYLGFTDKSNQVKDLMTAAKNIGSGPPSWNTDYVDKEKAQPTLDSIMGDLILDVMDIAQTNGVSLTTGDLEMDRLKKDVFELAFHHKGFSDAYNKKMTEYPGIQVKITGTSTFTAKGTTISFDIEILAPQIDAKAIEKGTNKTTSTASKSNATAANDAYNEARLKRRQILDKFLMDANIDLADFYSKAKSLFPTSTLEDLSQDQLSQVLALYGDQLDTKKAEILQKIKDMNGELLGALQDLAKQVSNADEFAAVFSAASQGVAEGIFTKDKMDELVNTALQSLEEELPKALDVQKIFAAALDSNGNLNVDLFKRLLTFETTAFGYMADGVKAAINEALTSNSVAGGIAVFSKNVKKAVGDSIISAMIEAITNQVFIGQIFGPFLEGFNTLLKGYTTGDTPLSAIFQYLNEQMPNLSDTINSAGEALTPLVQAIYDLFKNSGFLDAYQNTVNDQKSVVQQMLDIANKWDDILKQARAARSEILYGTSSPQNLRQQISDAQKDLGKQLNIFRTTSDVTKRQDAASQAISAIQNLFQLGNSAGSAGLADYQKTSASFQLFTRNLVSILDEITNAAIQGSSQIELLKRQIALLEAIEKNTAVAAGNNTTAAAADNNTPSTSAGGTEIQVDTGTGTATLTYSGQTQSDVMQVIMDSLVSKMQVSQESMFNKLSSMLNNFYSNKMREIIENVAYQGTINITVNGTPDKKTMENMASQIEEVVIRSVRRGKVGTEISRK